MWKKKKLEKSELELLNHLISDESDEENAVLEEKRESPGKGIKEYPLPRIYLS